MHEIRITVSGGQRRRVGTGWTPDRPDIRDRTEADALYFGRLRQRVGADAPAKLPSKKDLSKHFPPVEDQGQLGSCTANAAAGLVEYLQLRTHGTYLEMSRLFLYKVTRTYLNSPGDSGAYLRSVMGALRLFGAPPERFWPYDVAKFDDEPPAFLYAFAQNYNALEYHRLDPPNTTGAETLLSVKQHLALGVPAMFGFTVYQSIEQASDGDIPMPAPKEKVAGGHAVCVVGYDDRAVVVHPVTGARTTGAILIRNSWGATWGRNGYGRLPYAYVEQGLAEDFWVLLSGEFVDTAQFDE